AFVPLLDEAGVDAWNLIPIKDKKSLFLSPAEIREWSDEVAPRLEARLGAARVRLNSTTTQVFGATEPAREAAAAGRLPTHTRCFVPLRVAYIDARNGTLTACNCLAHRRGQPLSAEAVWERPFAETWSAPAYAESRAGFAAMASQVCTGCEPANVRFNRDFEAALAGGPEAAEPAWI
ncbi:MAG TPA: hypothetical protein VJT67_11310, partial [Longimicrobiaceae bacterium]|nr:hypothetical protein [Longimicrobiaceae bacterium]